MSPRTKEQNEEIRGLRMEQIVDACAHVYLEKGMMLEIRDVAARSGLGYGTVYHYFKNKHQLMEELLRQAMLQAEGLITEYLQSGSFPPRQRLMMYYKQLMKEWLVHPGLYIFYKAVTENFHTYPEDLGKELEPLFRERLHQPVVEAFREGVEGDPDRLANMMTGALIGFAGLHLHHRREAEDLGYAVEAIMSGMKERE